MKKLTEEEKRKIETDLNEQKDFGHYIHPFSGEGLKQLLEAVLHRGEYSMILCGNGRGRGDSTPHFSAGFFKDATKIGYAEGLDLNEVLTLGAAQALGVVPGGKEIIYAVTRPDERERDLTGRTYAFAQPEAETED